MKIYFLVYNIYGMGGTVKTVVNTANELSMRDYDVEIISLRRISKKPMFNINKGVKITPLMDVRREHVYPKNMSFFKKYLKKVLTHVPSIYMHKDEDLYKMFSLFSDIKLIRKLKSLNKGVVITTLPSFNVLGTKFLKDNIIQIGQEHKPRVQHTVKLTEYMDKYYFKLDALTCLVEQDCELYKNMGVNAVLIPNGTVTSNKYSDLTSKTVIAAGRFVDQKAFHMLIDAFSQVAKKHPDWKLKIFGDGFLKEKLVEQIFELELYNNVFLHPKTDNLNKEILNSSIYALSSIHESFGMVLIEAMVLGVPCVSYKCDGPMLIIDDGVDGILVEQNNVDMLGKEICNLIEDKEKLEMLAKNAIIKGNEYSIEKIVDRWENLLSTFVDLDDIKK